MVDWCFLGSSFAYILQTVTEIPIITLLTILIAPLILWMLISGIRGGIKIHNRDLAPLLEGNGWSLHHALYIPIWANENFSQKNQRCQPIKKYSRGTNSSIFIQKSTRFSS